jgi:hypothetical protein
MFQQPGERGGSLGLNPKEWLPQHIVRSVEALHDALQAFTFDVFFVLRRCHPEEFTQVGVCSAIITKDSVSDLICQPDMAGA